MDAISELWQTSWSLPAGTTFSDGRRPSLIVTTEDKSLLDDMLHLNASSRHGISMFHLAHNPYDVAQGTGSVKQVHHRHHRYNSSHNNNSSNYSLDEIMVSALSSLKLQLIPRFTMANCCSNFHLLLRDLLSAGCGASYPVHNTFQCLQDHPNTDHRLCCAWDKSERCKGKKLLHL